MKDVKTMYTPEDILDFVGMDKSEMPLYIKFNTIDKEVTFEVSEEIYTEWFLNSVDFGCGIEVYTILYFDEDAARKLIAFCLRCYPETIKNII